jgi:plasmid maintenance system antidote protein VapI
MARKPAAPGTMTDVLRCAIRDCGLNHFRLSEESGVSRLSIVRFARGERSLRLDMADKLATYFGLVLANKDR